MLARRTFLKIGAVGSAAFALETARSVAPGLRGRGLLSGDGVFEATSIARVAGGRLDRARRLMFELRPAVLHDHGLHEAMRVLASQVAREIVLGVDLPRSIEAYCASSLACSHATHGWT